MRTASVRNKLKWCNRWNVTNCRVTSAKKARQNESPKWDKLLLVNESLSLDAVDWVMWMDCDAVFTNYTTPYERILGQAVPTDVLLVAKSHSSPNMGVFFVRVSDKGKNLVQWLYERRPFLRRSAWKDQAALRDILHKNPSIKDWIHIIPQWEMNSYYQNSAGAAWKPGHWIAHQVNCRNKQCNRDFIRLATRPATIN